MPKTPMDEVAIIEKKEKILDIAAEIIMEEGYQSLSMRKIGSKIGMTAANIYNYFSNKDELNIAIRTRAGKILFDVLEKAHQNGGNIAEKIRFMFEAYIRFGMLQTNYYSIMFDMPTPKYADYVGTPLEILAREEKESSEKSLEFLDRCIGELKDEGYRLPENKDLFLIMMWSQLHGLISLYNNRLISELNNTPEKIVEQVTGLAYEIMFSFISKQS
ncbi:MAG: TetR/AcrR family transcriptional regulator [Deltaproteobacteria bacterium]|nr:TetR/AcrR family transcriptional regulator [Deltaproteobacteria bacterium]